jgi:hypothetical protein
MAEAILADGVALMTQGKYHEAENYFRDAAADSTPGSIVQGRAFGNLAGIQARRGDHEASLVFNEKAYGIFKHLGDVERQAVILYNIGFSEKALGKVSEAVGHMAESYALCKDKARGTNALTWLFAHVDAAADAGVLIDGVPIMEAAASYNRMHPPPPLTSPLATDGSSSNLKGPTGPATHFTPLEALHSASGLASVLSSAVLESAHQSGVIAAALQTKDSTTSEGFRDSTASTTMSPNPRSRVSSADAAVPGGTAAGLEGAAATGRILARTAARQIRQVALQAINAAPSAIAAASSISIAPGNVVAPAMLEHNFDNLWYGDVVARHERGLATLDAIEALVRTRASASESYARSLHECSTTLAPILAFTGLGIGPQVHASAKQSSGTVVMNAVRSAFSLFGSAAPPEPIPTEITSPSSASSMPGEKMGQVHRKHGGFDTMAAALAGVRKTYLREAVEHHKASGFMKDILQKLQNYRAVHSQNAARFLARAQEASKVAQTAAHNLRKSNTALEKARKDAEDATERYVSAKDSGAVADAEVQRRLKKHTEASTVARVAEDAVRDAGEVLVTARRSRDEELGVVARALQRLDEERQAVVANVVRLLTALAAQTAEASMDATGRAHAFTESIDTASDERMFVHQRRVAIMMDELISRATIRNRGTSAGGSAELAVGMITDADDMSKLIPNPYTSMSSHRHKKDYIQSEAELAPTMFRWVNALLKGEGLELLNGVPVTPELAGVVGSDDKPPVTFEVSLLDDDAARHAFLRALSARRSLQQRIDASFHRMCRIFWWVLDACLEREDARGAGTVLILSETYFQGRTTDDPSAPIASAVTGSGEGGGGAEDRQYVQAFLTHHPIWRADFWQESFYRSVRMK